MSSPREGARLAGFSSSPTRSGVATGAPCRVAGARSRPGRAAAPADRRAPRRRRSRGRSAPRRRSAPPATPPSSVRNVRRSSGTSSSRCSFRPAKSAKRGSAARSGRPSASQSRSQNLLRARDDDPPVRGGKVLEGHHRRVGGLREALGLVAPGRHPRADVHELVQRRLEERDVAVAADPVAPGAPEAGDQASAET